MTRTFSRRIATLVAATILCLGQSRCASEDAETPERTTQEQNSEAVSVARTHLVKTITEELKRIGSRTRGTIVIHDREDGCEVGLGNIPDAAIPLILQLQPVKELTLAKCDWSAESFRLLSNCTHLKRLYLYKCNVTDEHMEVTKGFTNLEHLYIAGGTITGKGVATIKNLRRLQELNLEELPSIEPGTFSALSELDELTELVVFRCAFSDIDLGYIVNLRKLKYVILSETVLTDKSENDWYALFMVTPKLRAIHLQGTQISREVFERIEARLPPKAVAIPPDHGRNNR